MKVIGYQNYQYIKEMGKKCVIVFWHGQQFYPIYHFRDHKIAIMVSLSNDGEIQNKILSSFGYQVVRGSSSRGAVSGLIGLIKKMRDGSDVAIALDGPRGPYQTAKEGVNFIAIKEDCFVLPIACAFKSYKQFGAWDKYMLPYPYSSGVMLIGRPIMPNKLNIAAMTHKHLEKILISMSEDAKKVLAGNIKPAGQTPKKLESNPAAVIIPAAAETEAIAGGGGDNNGENIIMPHRIEKSGETLSAITETAGGEYEQAGGGKTSRESGYAESRSQYGEGEGEGAAYNESPQSPAAEDERIYTFKTGDAASEYSEDEIEGNGEGEVSNNDSYATEYNTDDKNENDDDNSDSDSDSDSGRDILEKHDIADGVNNYGPDKIKPRKKIKPELID
jgi:hypothetical protein